MLEVQCKASCRVPRGRGVSAGVYGEQVPVARLQPGEAVGAGPVGLPRSGTPYPAEGLLVRIPTVASLGACFAPLGGQIDFEQGFALLKN